MQFADLTRDELMVVDIQAEQDVVALGGRIVCAFPTGTLTLTPTLWARLTDKFRALGRTLTEQELQAVVRAEAGDDRDA